MFWSAVVFESVSLSSGEIPHEIRFEIDGRVSFDVKIASGEICRLVVTAHELFDVAMVVVSLSKKHP